MKTFQRLNLGMVALIVTSLVADRVRAFQTVPNLGKKTSDPSVVGCGISSSRRGQMRLPHLSSTCESQLDSDLHDIESNHIMLDQKTWMFQGKHPIAYEVASSSSTSDNTSGEIVPVLLLNGFGVGSFHQHRLMRQLLLQRDEQQIKQQYVIYGIDYLGQGKSWPADCNDGDSNNELNLGYSADMWLDQLKGFIEEIIGKKVHLAGNSVGGYLSTILTNRHPNLIASLILMNATPVWGLNLPGWDGKLPAPTLSRMVGRAMFDTIRNEDVIGKYLEAAYVHREAFDGTFSDNSFGDSGGIATGDTNALGPKIKSCTEGKGGHAAFASILWSPPASERKEGEYTTSTTATILEPTDFYDALGNLPVDVLLLFGEDDPWCTPAVAKRMHSTLFDRRAVAAADASPAQRYISLGNVGHCPNHEAPTAVARVLLPWIMGVSPEQSRRDVALALSRSAEIREPWGVVIPREVSIVESQNLGFIDKIVSSMVG